jgi:biopolymer transport protein ExbB
MIRSGRAGLLAIVLTLSGTTSILAQEPAGDAERTVDSVRVAAAPQARGKAGTAKSARGRSDAQVNVLALFRQANPMIWPLAICSVVAFGFALERMIALRRGRVIPREFVSRFMDRLSAGKLDRERAAELCRANESPAARILGRVVHHWGQPAGAIREAVSHDAAAEMLDFKRHVRVLNGTATLAPLLGLLGTVIGMIESFDALGGRTAAGTGKGEALAHGISLALMTTAFGLFIAIISVTFYYYLLNRIDVLVRELDQHAGQAIDLIAGDTGRPIADRRTVGGPSDLTRQALRD